ncbi:MAG TPA: ABC transporter permease [Baekduia sp.]|nr:ABC transporter permease [Baekduia sp.]
MSATAAPPVARAAPPARGALADELVAIGVVWHRELLRFGRNRLRMVTSLVQPLLFLFVLGSGLSSMLPSSGGVDFRTFMFPGIIAMSVLFTSLFSALSIVWDREFGFLREMLVAPVHRGAIVLGKCAGGATIATIQGSVILLLAGAVHVPYAPELLLALLGFMVVTAVALTALGLLLASRMQQIESFMAVMNFVTLPMFFLAGAIFPPRGLPEWLSVLTKLDPLTYAVDPMRREVFAHVEASPALERTLSAGVRWGSWTVPIGVELAIVAAVGALSLVLAIKAFARAE